MKQLCERIMALSLMIDEDYLALIRDADNPLGGSNNILVRLMQDADEFYDEHLLRELIDRVADLHAREKRPAALHMLAHLHMLEALHHRFRLRGELSDEYRNAMVEQAMEHMRGYGGMTPHPPLGKPYFMELLARVIPPGNREQVDAQFQPTVTAAFPAIKGAEGIVLEFRFRMSGLPGAAGTVVLDPSCVLLFNEAFVENVRHVCSCLGERAIGPGDPGVVVSLGLRFDRDYRNFLRKFLHPVRGASMQGALATGLLAFRERNMLNRRFILSFKIDRELSCRPIGGDEEKSELVVDPPVDENLDLYSGREMTLLFSASQAHEYRFLERNIRRVASVDDALRLCRIDARYLGRYLETLREIFDATPWTVRGKVLRKSELAIPRMVQKRTSGLLITPDPVSWEEACASHARLVLVAPPGEGKTFLLQLQCRRMIEALLARMREGRFDDASALFPVYVSPDLIADGASVPDVLRESLRDYPDEVKTAIQAAVKSWRFMLFIDGMEELAGGVPSRVSALLTGVPDHVRIVFACSTNAWNEKRVPLRADQYDVFDLLPFDPLAVEEFILGMARTEPSLDEHYRKDLARLPSLSFHLQRPLLTAIYAIVRTEQPEDWKASMTELYRAIVAKLLRQPDAASVALPSSFVANERFLDMVQETLAGLAWQLFLRHPGQQHFTMRQVLDAFHRVDPPRLPALPDDPGASAKEFPDKLLDAAFARNLLEKRRSDDSVVFPVHTIMEFLAAKHAATLIDASGTLHARLPGAPRWKTMRRYLDELSWRPEAYPFLVFLAGLIESAPARLQLLGLLSNGHADDYLRRRLVLASQCLFEMHATPLLDIRRALRIG
jgi:hypothetical protein